VQTTTVNKYRINASENRKLKKETNKIGREINQIIKKIRKNWRKSKPVPEVPNTVHNFYSFRP